MNDPIAELALAWRNEARQFRAQGGVPAAVLAVERENAAVRLEAAMRLRPRGSQEQIDRIAVLEAELKAYRDTTTSTAAALGLIVDNSKSPT